MSGKLKYGVLEYYTILKTPRDMRYKLADKLDVSVFVSGGWYVASCVDDTISNAYGVGSSMEDAVTSLLEQMMDDYDRFTRYLYKGKLGPELIQQQCKLDNLFKARKNTTKDNKDIHCGKDKLC